MRRHTRLFALVAALAPVPASAEPVEPQFCGRDWATPFDAAAAWQEFRAYVDQNYAYRDRIDAAALFDAFAPRALAARTNAEFAGVLLAIVPRFRDGHFHVQPVPGPERAWAPSASDLWVETRDGRTMVVDVKGDSAAARAGIRPGWEVVSIEGEPVARAVAAFDLLPGLPLSAAQRDYVANSLLTGFLGAPRRIGFRAGGVARELTLPPGYASAASPAGLLSIRTIEAGGSPVAIVRFNNSLGKNDLVAAFDAAAPALGAARAVVLDLRDTPSGGNTTVARAIIGHFIGTERPYQLHDNGYERFVFGVPRRTLELASPRAPAVARPVAVLVGRWTGSMGEGLAIGMQAAAGATLIGAPMADLLGDLKKKKLGRSCLTVQLAWDRLYTVGGTPREDVVADRAMDAADTGADGGDPALAAALAWAADANAPK